MATHIRDVSEHCGAVSRLVTTYVVVFLEKGLFAANNALENSRGKSSDGEKQNSVENYFPSSDYVSLIGSLDYLAAKPKNLEVYFPLKLVFQKQMIFPLLYACFSRVQIWLASSS